ncbi:hypothetical protein CYMTET_29488 [Cymbomonas tetramitiformis]|uniref:Anoctamin transmembrane domain-containing protein n=1 Tax=Cymbomonas tetramitiformis TaxID=36881 RepID=A0AAE0FL42_9CHLO|nr:hypothetical protein CYMTET_29488 [Cymbomonas tetramitiformis]|eukprot:gene14156-16740_t
MAFFLPNNSGPAVLVGEPAATVAELAAAAELLTPANAKIALPLHDPATSGSLLRRSTQERNLPLDDLTAYFGHRAGNYFTFMNTYINGLALPSGLATLLMLLRLRRKGKPDGPVTQAATRLCVALWGVRLVHALKSTQHANTEAKEDPMPADARQLRRTSTGQALKNTAVTIVILAAVKAILITSLNLQGYIKSSASRCAIPVLQRMAAPGGVCDAEHSIKGLAPVIIHSLIINALNTRYTALCQKQAASDGTGNSAVLMKRLFFEGLDTFLPLWWLSVVRADRPALADELLSLLRNDPIRRLLVESILPLLQLRQGASFLRMVLLRSRLQGKPPKDRLAFLLHTVSNEGGDDKKNLESAPADVEDLVEWEDFDDWVEMVAQFATLMFFGPNAPYAFPVVLLSNVLEARSDVFKLCCCTRRPALESIENVSREISTWHGTLKLIAYVGAVVNIGAALHILATTRCKQVLCDSNTR